MPFCFFCDKKLRGECTWVCSSMTLHSNIPFPKKINEMLGERIGVIVSDDDRMCKKCTSILNRLDECEIDLKLAKEQLEFQTQRNHGLWSDQAGNSVEVVNGPLMAEEQEEAADIGGEDEKDAAVPKQEVADQETPNEIMENETGGLDIESLIAAVRIDPSPTNSGDKQHNA